MAVIPESVTIHRDFIPKGRGNRPGLSMEPKGLCFHETGNTSKGADAAAHTRYIKGEAAASMPVSWHYTVDSREIWKHLPLTENGWHAADGYSGWGNRNTVGIEMCVNSNGNLAQCRANTIWLATMLIMEVPTIAEIVVRGKSIFQHWDFNNSRNCPRLLRKNGWVGFVETLIDNLKRELHRRDSIATSDTELALRVGRLTTDLETLAKDVTKLDSRIKSAGGVLSG